jgi:hypothetical protein
LHPHPWPNGWGIGPRSRGLQVRDFSKDHFACCHCPEASGPVSTAPILPPGPKVAVAARSPDSRSHGKRAARPQRPVAPIAKLAAVTAEVVAPPGDRWLRSVCRPWRLALGTLHHTRYKSKALEHTLPMYPLYATTGARTQVARITADSHNQLDVADLLKRFSVDL